MSDLNEILHQSLSKTFQDRGYFEFDRAKSENNITENWFALGHETDNSNWHIRKCGGKSVAGLKSNLFATMLIIPSKKQAEF